MRDANNQSPASMHTRMYLCISTNTRAQRTINKVGRSTHYTYGGVSVNQGICGDALRYAWLHTARTTTCTRCYGGCNL